MTCAAIAEVDHIALQGELLLADAFQANSSDSKVEQRAKVISFTTTRVRSSLYPQHPVVIHVAAWCFAQQRFTNLINSCEQLSLKLSSDDAELKRVTCRSPGQTVLVVKLLGKEVRVPLLGPL